MATEQEFVPRQPDYKGTLQTPPKKDGKAWIEVGEIALWKHPESRYCLRGTVKMPNGQKVNVSLVYNEQNYEEQE